MARGSYKQELLCLASATLARTKPCTLSQLYSFNLAN